MSQTDEYIRELGAALHVRGRARRRLLQECRDHLTDASEIHGERDAARRFGSPSELAASFDTEIAARRARFAGLATMGGVLAVGGSTLAIADAASATAAAVVAWAVLFFAAAQAAVAGWALVALQTLAQRGDNLGGNDIALLCRRSAFALTTALLAMFAAAAAIPGRGSGVAILAGPLLAMLAAVLVLRAWLLARHLADYRQATLRSPVADLTALLGDRRFGLSPRALLTATLMLVVPGAFWWDSNDGGTVSSSLALAGVESALVSAGFLVFGATLGLRPRIRRARSTTPGR